MLSVCASINNVQVGLNRQVAGEGGDPGSPNIGNCEDERKKFGSQTGGAGSVLLASGWQGNVWRVQTMPRRYQMLSGGFDGKDRNVVQSQQIWGRVVGRRQFLGD